MNLISISGVFSFGLISTASVFPSGIPVQSRVGIFSTEKTRSSPGAALLHLLIKTRASAG